MEVLKLDDRVVGLKVTVFKTEPGRVLVDFIDADGVPHTRIPIAPDALVVLPETVSHG